MCLIEVVEGPNAGHTYRFDRDELIVGRLAYCDIIINQKNVSRQHARLLSSGGDYFVEDLNSTNGTFLNGKRVLARTRLKARDLIRVYNVTLRFREDEAAQDGASEGEPSSLGVPSEPVVVGEHPAKTTQLGDGRHGGRRQSVELNAYEKLKTVLEIHRTLGSTLDIDLVLPKILDGLFSV
jgi:pSer/pThr/pTyr-binding forkhead associated (FHA) protein